MEVPNDGETPMMCPPLYHGAATAKRVERHPDQKNSVIIMKTIQLLLLTFNPNYTNTLSFLIL